MARPGVGCIAEASSAFGPSGYKLLACTPVLFLSPVPGVASRTSAKIAGVFPSHLASFLGPCGCIILRM